MAKSKVTIEMSNEKDCKGSVRYATKEVGAVATNVYVDRTFADPMPNKVKVTIEEV